MVPEVHVKIKPQDGGCWYCNKIFGEMMFSTEFDTYLHEECLKKRLKEDAEDREAKIIARELL